MKHLNFAKIPQTHKLPDLLEMQKNSFREVLQLERKPADRTIQGLQAAFMDVFPVSSADESLQLEFMHYTLGEPRYTVEEALSKDGSYSSQLRAWLRLVQKHMMKSP